MRLKIDQFLRSFGLRQASELQTPRLHPINKFDFPMETVYHFQSDNQAVLGPSQVDPIIAKLKGKVFIDHITELKSEVGNPRRTSVLAPTLLNDFRRQHRFFKPLRRDESVKLNQQNVAIFNYNLLNPLYRYVASYKANYYRWLNDTATFWDGVQTACTRYPEWNHFIELHVPESMPTMAQFKMLQTSQTQNLLEIFRNGELLNLFDIYRFLGPDRKTSFISQVDKKYFHRINFFIRVQGSFFVINLGRLDEWREQTEEEKEADKLAEEAVGLEAMSMAERLDYGFETYTNEFGLEAYFKPELIQRRFVSLMTTLVEYAAGNDQLIENDANVQANALIEAKAEAEEPEIQVNPDDEDADFSEADEPDEINPQPIVSEPGEVDIDTPPLSKVYRSFDLDVLQVTFEPPPSMDLEKTTLNIETDEMSQAAAKTLKVEQSRPVTVVNQEFTTGDKMLDGVAKRAFRLAKVGMISERTFEQAIDDAQRYETMPDPFGSGLTVKEAMQYSPEDFEVPVDDFPDKTTILDKTMLRSVHKSMMRKYVKKLLPKDILQSIMAIQRQGVAVTDIKIQENEDAMNHTQTFTVTVKPVRGMASQLTFTIPVIDRDGRFLSNGVTYRSRTQRADVPIRKVSPTRVALTSYTNKTFVLRSPRAEHAFDLWLTRQIDVKARDASNPIVTNQKYAELDLSEFHLPRTYTALATKFTGFDNGSNHLYFNYPNRAKYFKEKFNIDPEFNEIDGMVMVGVREGQPILLDKSGIFYLKDSNELEPMGNILDLTGINATKAPLEAVDVKISGKDIPIGFVLAYQQGLTNLLNKLGVAYQAHPRGTRIVVGSEDYTLAFNDEILVFPRDDYKSMLVLGGLRRYHKVLRNYSRYDFDKKDVYHRVLIEQDMGNRFIREIEFLFEAFVDPITEGMLVEMGEPTDFEGLLFRSVELLMEDWSPGEVDGQYMRYRGYERIAGQIYSSLSKAVKRYNSREGSTDVKVILDRHEVWTNINDPTVATIEDSNPIANLREQEAMTYRGDGGRAAVSMVARTRIYGESDLGVVSESTVDSGDVGIIAYLTPDANFTSMRGLTRLYDPEKDGKSKLLSTSALLGVGIAHDDCVLNICKVYTPINI